MELSDLIQECEWLSTGPQEKPDPSISTVLSDWLSEFLDPHHLKAWLSLHFGHGGFHVNRYSGKEAVDVNGENKKMYEIWAPREIQEVSMILQRELVPIWYFEVRDSGRFPRKLGQKSAVKKSNIRKSVRDVWRRTFRR